MDVQGHKHRGRHPADEALFAAEALGILRAATAELSWLLDRGYSQAAALKLVGDHHQLRQRQRLAVLRCACGDQGCASRGARRLGLEDLSGRTVAVDGFNCLITIETALGGGLLLRGRDRVLRDLAGVHGNYESAAETEPAVRALGGVLAAVGPTVVRVLLDRPVSNSGRLRHLVQDISAGAGWRWEVSLVDNPDRELLVDVGSIVASSDGVVLDRCGSWVPLADLVVAAHAPSAWIVDLGSATPADVIRT